MPSSWATTRPSVGCVPPPAKGGARRATALRPTAPVATRRGPARAARGSGAPGPARSARCAPRGSTRCGYPQATGGPATRPCARPVFPRAGSGAATGRRRRPRRFRPGPRPRRVATKIKSIAITLSCRNAPSASDCADSRPLPRTERPAAAAALTYCPSGCNSQASRWSLRYRCKHSSMMRARSWGSVTGQASSTRRSMLRFIQSALDSHSSSVSP
jgi:hypothetical protein